MPRDPIESNRLLKPAEAARFLGLAEGTVRNKASAGELPTVKLGTALRFRLSELEAWIAEQDARAKAEAAAESDAAA